MGKIRIKQVREDLESKAEEKRKAKRKTKKLEKKQPGFRSARYKKLAAKAKPSNEIKGLALNQAVALAKKTATARFSESIEAHINVQKQGFSASVTLPHSTGKAKKILILTENPKEAEKAKPSNEIKGLALNFASASEIEKIKKSGSAPDLDEIWATPDIMSKIAPIAKILGPKGLMPNPKRKTIVKQKDLEKKIKELSKGKITLETEKKAPIIHTVLGKAKMPEKQLAENLEAIIAAIGPKNIKKLVLSATMGPGIKLMV